MIYRRNPQKKERLLALQDEQNKLFEKRRIAPINELTEIDNQIEKIQKEIETLYNNKFKLQNTKDNKILPSLKNEIETMIPMNDEKMSNPVFAFFNRVWKDIPDLVRPILAVAFFITIIGGGWYFIFKQDEEKLFTISGILIGKTSSKPLNNVTITLEHNSMIKDNTVIDGVFELAEVNIPQNKLITFIVIYPDETRDFVERINFQNLPISKNNIIDIGTRKVKDLSTTSVNPKNDNKVPIHKSQPKNGGDKNISNSKIEGSTIIQAEKVFINPSSDTSKKK